MLKRPRNHEKTLEPATINPSAPRVSLYKSLISFSLSPPPPPPKEPTFKERETRTQRLCENGEVFEAKQGGDTPAGTVRRSQGRDRSVLRRRHPRQALRSLFGCGDKEVPEQGDPQGLGQEDGQEVPRQGLHQAREFPAPDAHALHLGRGFERRGRRGFASVQGQESQCGQRDQEEARGAFQDWEE